MNPDKLKLPSYGGQALIEGVLMRGSKYLAVAMRDPSGSIQIKTEKLQGLYTSRFAKIPFLRGLVILWDAIGLGTKYLTISANLQTGEDEKIEGPALVGTLFFSFSLAIVLFFLAPAGVAALIQKWLIIDSFSTNIIEGVFRLVLVIGYIWAVGKIPDIRRVFSYHGAEHKTINAFEAGAELTPENVKGFSLHHPRCGTGFILILVIFSVILFTLIGPLPNIAVRLVSRVVLLPLLVMFAYEFIRFTARHLDNRFIRLLSKPGMAMQRLTTFEPSLDIIEVSIASFNAMYRLENSEDQ
ncbi:MAG: hypothetical protein FD147_157 [Chloroflexi bacterium]|nr:MAG: hypothetical protein FD147_157 [Chloroflexota bacterium]